MVERLGYKVLKKDGKIELREYPAHILAEVDVRDKDFKNAANSGFGPLADFIFGNNTSKSGISMTAPVEITRSEKIAMTAPVKVQKSAKVYTVSFVMPKRYTLESLPKPGNKEVRIKKVSGYNAAAIRFSGFFNEKKISKKADELAAWVKKEGLKPKGSIIVAGYDPPWVPFFLARNEVMVIV